MRHDLRYSHLRVLIVEDEALVADELSERLSRLGFSVIGTADSADQGIAMATRERPDLILMDIRLKGKKDGVQAADEIRGLLDTSIVYVTALSDAATVERAKRTEHDGFLLKPFQRTDLQSTIDIAMLRRAARAREREN